MTSYTTLGGYAVLVGFGGMVYYLSQRKISKGPRSKLSTKQIKLVETQKPTKAKKQRKDGGQSSGDQDGDKSEKAPKKKKQVPAEDWSNRATQASSDRDEEIDNKEFARQLSSTKSGTLLPSKTAEGSYQKSVKQSKAQEKAAGLETSSDVTAPSSAAGGDADDDRSSINSPELSATSNDTPITNGGISDMLEAPAPGPSVLRVTSPTNSAPPKKAKAPAAFEQTETKKQRQNRKKAELKKAEREEEEKQRKVALEKQRRTAREAEGRAAKDGRAFLAAKAPSTSAWTALPAPVAAVNGNQTTNKSNVDLLHTYEPSRTKATASSNSESEQVGGDWQKIASSLSEEEQLRMISESENWETVKDKKNKKKGKAIQSPPQEKNEVAAEKGQTVYEQGAHRTVIPPTGPGQEWTLTLEKTLETGDKVEYERDLQDSEWDVAGYDQ
jgi:hypothetical protein